MTNENLFDVFNVETDVIKIKAETINSIIDYISAEKINIIKNEKVLLDRYIYRIEIGDESISTLVVDLEKELKLVLYKIENEKIYYFFVSYNKINKILNIKVADNTEDLIKGFDISYEEFEEQLQNSVVETIQSIHALKTMIMLSFYTEGNENHTFDISLIKELDNKKINQYVIKPDILMNYKKSILKYKN